MRIDGTAMKGLLKAMCALLALMLAVSPLAAGEVEDFVEDGIKRALLDSGMKGAETFRIARQYVFIGTVMISGKYLNFSEDAGALDSVSAETGYALGSALAVTRGIYGDKKLQDTANIMMLSARAGISPATASTTFETLAVNGYSFEEALSILRETAEAVRVIRGPDGGETFSKRICDLAANRAPASGVKSEISSLAERERTRQKELLAKNEMERMKNLGPASGGDGGDPGRRSGNSSQSSRSAVSKNPSGGDGGAASAAGSSGGGESSESSPSGNSSEGGSGSSDGGSSGGDSSGGDSSSGNPSEGGSGSSDGDSSGGGNTSEGGGQ
ncbi:MAG: hypothetical protein LBS75_10090 [Synergistaceae bacterium]|jgi:hypothetical protein|nr:hypothetical protein [Synergistaceae bacterium]